MKRFTHAELAALQGEGNWAELWKQAIPLVKLAIRKSVKRGAIRADDADADLLQQGMLVAGEAIRTWNPFECAFSTHVVLRVRGDLFNYITTRSRGGIGSYKQRPDVVNMGDARDGLLGCGSDEHVEEEIEDDGSFEAALTYEGVVRPGGQFDGMGDSPAGFGDPAYEADRAYAEQAVHSAISRLTPGHQHILLALAGLCGKPETVEEYADRVGCSRRTAFTRLAAARQALALNLPNFRHM